MNCADAKKLLYAHADGRLPASQRAGVDAHLGECPICREEAERTAANSAFLTDRLALLPGLADSAPAFLTDLLAPKKGVAQKAARAEESAGLRRAVLFIVVAAVLVAAAAAVFLLTREKAAAPSATGDAGTRARAPSGARRPAALPEDRPRSTPPATTPQPPHREDPPDGEPTGAAAPPRFTAVQKGFEELVALFLRRPSTESLTRLRAAYAERPGSVGDILDRIRKDTDPSKRALLVFALIPARDVPAVFDEVSQRIGNDSAPGVRSAAAAVLGAAEPDEATGEGLVIVRGIRVPAGPIRNPGRIDRLLAAAVSERDPTVLACIARLLGPSATEDRRVEDLLRELADSAIPSLSAAADEALEQGRKPTPDETLNRARDKTLSVARRVRAIEALSEAESAVDLLREFLTDDEAALQIAALNGLERHWEGGGSRLVITVLRSQAAEGVRLAALAIAASKDGPAALDAIREVAESAGGDTELARAAKEALRIKEQR